MSIFSGVQGAGGNTGGGAPSTSPFVIGPMTQAEWDAAQNARNAAAPPPPPAAPSTSPFVIGPVPTGTPNMAAVNPYMPAQPTMQAQPAKQAMQAQQAPTAGNALPNYANSNPYLQGAMNSIQSQVTNNLTRNVLPQIGRNAVASGNYGSSRQGIAQGIAMGDAARAATDAMGNLAFQGYNADRNYGLANDAMDLNVYNANQGWQQQGAMNQLNALDRMLGWNQQYGIGNATGVQNTPLNYWQQFANTGAQLGGMGGSQTQNLQGNPYLGALGGALTGAQLWKAWGG